MSSVLLRYARAYANVLFALSSASATEASSSLAVAASASAKDISPLRVVVVYTEFSNNIENSATAPMLALPLSTAVPLLEP